MYYICTYVSWSCFLLPLLSCSSSFLPPLRFRKKACFTSIPFCSHRKIPAAVFVQLMKPASVDTWVVVPSFNNGFYEPSDQYSSPNCSHPPLMFECVSPGGEWFCGTINLPHETNVNDIHHCCYIMHHTFMVMAGRRGDPAILKALAPEAHHSL